jgi:hypothetical protein
MRLLFREPRRDEVAAFATDRENPIVPSQARPRKKSICSMSGLWSVPDQRRSRPDRRENSE